MNQFQALYRLQEIDLNAAQIQKRVTEIEAALADKHALVEAQNQINSTKQTLAPIQKKARGLELEVQANTEKIRLTDERMYSGRVQNPKELQDMQQEIQSLKKRNSELEDALLETMLQAENMEDVLHEQENTLKQVNETWEVSHGALLVELSNLKSDYQMLRQKREQALSAVNKESLEAYNALRSRKNNQPMAFLIDGSCSVCRVEQNMAVISEVRKGQNFTYCVSCGRILVYQSG